MNKVDRKPTTCMVKSFLTGRRRYRSAPVSEYAHQSGFKVQSVMILQVERSVWGDGKWVCVWDDATPDDITKDETI